MTALSWLKQLSGKSEQMATSSASSLNSSRDYEPVMECCLTLSTLSGTVVELTTSVAKYDRFEDFEDQVVDYLASVTDLKVFGCTVDFLHPNTHTYLEDPIWEGLQKNTEFTMVFRDCSEVLHSKEIFEGCPYRDIPQAVQVPNEPGRNRSCGCVHGSAALASRQHRSRHQGNWSGGVAVLPTSSGGKDAQFSGENCGQYLPRMPTAQLRYSARLCGVRT